MQENDDLLDHVNKVKALTDQLACLEVLVRDEKIILNLLKGLPASYEHSITTMKIMLMKELIIAHLFMRSAQNTMGTKETPK